MKSNLKKAYPETPESFHSAMEDALTKVAHMKKEKRMKLSAVLIAALIGTLILASLAYAATRSGILYHLFGDRTPSKEAESLLTEVGQSIEKEGVRFTFEDYLIDGDAVMFAYTIESSRSESVFITNLNYAILFPEYGSDIDTRDYVESMRVLGGTIGGVSMPSSYSSMESLWTTTLPEKPFELTFIIRASKPLCPMTLYESAESWDDTLEEDMAAFKQAGVIPVYKEGYTPFPKWFVLDRSGRGATELSAEAGYVEPITEFTLTVTIDPAKKDIQPRAYLSEPAVFEFDEYTIVIEKVEITAASKTIQMNVMPRVRYEDSGLSREDYINLFAKEYSALDASGQDIFGEYPLMDIYYEDVKADIYLAEHDGELGDDIDEYYRPQEPFVPYYEKGFSCWSHIEMDNLVSELPAELTIVPAIRGEDHKVAGYEMDKAMTITLERAEGM